MNPQFKENQKACRTVGLVVLAGVLIGLVSNHTQTHRHFNTYTEARLAVQDYEKENDDVSCHSDQSRFTGEWMTNSYVCYEDGKVVRRYYF